MTAPAAHHPEASSPPEASAPTTSWGSPLVISMWLLIVVAVVMGPLDISSGAPKMTVGLDSTVACKLLVAGLASMLGLYAVLTSTATRQTLMTLPSVAIITILLLAGLATPIAISSTSLPTTLINFGYLMFTVTALLTLKLRGVGLALLAGVTVTCSIALSLWFFVPSYGVFPELLEGGLIVKRLSGTAHPNAVGRAMMLGLILTLYFYRTDVLPALPTGVLVGMFTLAAYLTLSRTAMVAGAAGVVILYLDVIFSRAGILAMSFAVVLGICGVTTIYMQGDEDRFIDKILTKFSKSGNAEEITSGTGRSEIWAKAASLIGNRPIIGHGFNAAPTLMIDHSQATHNAVLQATLAAGIIGGVLMFGLMAWNVYLVTSSNALLIRALAALIVIASLAEDAVLETFPGPLTIAFFVCSVYPVMVTAPNSQPGTESRSIAGLAGDAA
ncbi:O-antigen ligase family protein [Rhodopirellula sallentina]|uniref:Cap5J protein-transmembrane protein n=1 Tax=Rhodopirellula sallentina SM41 TaxID=1263870 RepID=M5U843_9BACT|nr:O-antigen ligase family protein [Rhodopirellula sallentina]EMI57615.1 Cap5J protein- transmembrane protein [Rhodopirellula sallentina SM41]